MLQHAEDATLNCHENPKKYNTKIRFPSFTCWGKMLLRKNRAAISYEGKAFSPF